MSQSKEILGNNSDALPPKTGAEGLSLLTSVSNNEVRITSEKVAASQKRATPDDPLSQADAQIEAHEKQTRSQSVLSSIIDSAWRRDDRSLTQLKELRQQATTANGDKQALGKIKTDLAAAVKTDREELNLQQKIGTYGSAALTTASLFLIGGRGKAAGSMIASPWIGRAATALTFGLDQARVGDSTLTQTTDFALGATKGMALRGTMGLLNRFSLNAPAQGIALGTTSRLLENTLNRNTFIDSQTGQWRAPDAAIRDIAANTFGSGALLTDAAMFTLAHGVAGKVGGVLPSRFADSAFGRTVTMSSSFGFAKGVTTQAQAEWNKGLPTSLEQVKSSATEILKSGLTHAVIDGLAGVPGGLQARKVQLSELSNNRRAASVQPERLFRSPRVASQLRSAETPEITGRGRTAEEIATKTPLELIEMKSSSAEILKAAQARREAGKTQVENIPVEMANISNSKLTYQSENYSIATLKKGAASKTFESEAEFAERGIETVSTPSRIYRSPDKLVDVIVPESYAKQLDSVREIRRQLETETAPEKLDQLRADLQKNPLGDRALPEDIFAIIDALPTKNVIDKIVLSGEPNPYDVWFKQQYGKDFVSAADTGRYGDITFYKRSIDRNIAEEMFHEWGHNEGNSNRQMSRLFEIARQFEPDGSFSRDYAKNSGEALPVNLGEQVMGLSGPAAHQFALSAPIRTSVLSRGLRETLQAGKQMHEPSSLNDSFVRRLDLFDTEISPIARAKLIEAANGHSDSKMAHDAALLLAFIGKPADMARLTKTESVDLSQIPVTPEIVENLSHVPNLRKVNLSHTGISGDELGSFSKQPIESFNLSGLNIMNYHLLPIARIRTMRELNVTGTLVNDGAIPIFSNMTLRLLDSTRSDMTEAGKQELRNRKPDLEVR